MKIPVANPFLLLGVPSKEAFQSIFKYVWLVNVDGKPFWFATDGYMFALYDADKGLESVERELDELASIKNALADLLTNKRGVSAYKPRALRLLTRASDLELDIETLAVTGTVDGVTMTVRPEAEPGELPDFMAQPGAPDARPVGKVNPKSHVKILRMFELLFGRSTDYAHVSTTVKTIHYHDEDDTLRVWIARIRG